MTLRTYEYRDNRVTLKRLVPFWNHSVRCWREAVAGSVLTDKEWVKRLAGVLWQVFGIRV